MFLSTIFNTLVFTESLYAARKGQVPQKFEDYDCITKLKQNDSTHRRMRYVHNPNGHYNSRLSFLDGEEEIVMRSSNSDLQENIYIFSSSLSNMIDLDKTDGLYHNAQIVNSHFMKNYTIKNIPKKRTQLNVSNVIDFFLNAYDVKDAPNVESIKECIAFAWTRLQNYNDHMLLFINVMMYNTTGLQTIKFHRHSPELVVEKMLLIPIAYNTSPRRCNVGNFMIDKLAATIDLWMRIVDNSRISSNPAAYCERMEHMFDVCPVNRRIFISKCYNTAAKLRC